MGPKELAKNLKKGKIFIYPGNEAYEVICDASAISSVDKLINAGIDGIWSLVINNKKWVYKNLKANRHYVEKLPGPFTFIFKVRDSNGLVKYNINDDIVAIRMTDNKLIKSLAKEDLVLFSYILKREGRLVIDANKIPKGVKKVADFLIDSGILETKPHVILDLTGTIARIVK